MPVITRRNHMWTFMLLVLCAVLLAYGLIIEALSLLTGGCTP